MFLRRQLVRDFRRDRGNPGLAKRDGTGVGTIDRSGFLQFTQLALMLLSQLQKLRRLGQ